MRVSTNRATAAVRDMLDSTSNPVTTKQELTLMQTATTSFTDIRRSVFIEVREFGAEAVLARSAIQIPRTIQPRGRRPSHRAYSDPFSMQAKSHVLALTDIAIGDFCEIYFTKDGLHVKRTNMSNISTPYVVKNKVEQGEFSMISVPNFAVATSYDLRKQFTQDVYTLAQASDNAMYKVAALR